MKKRSPKKLAIPKGKANFFDAGKHGLRQPEDFALYTPISAHARVRYVCLTMYRHASFGQCLLL